MPRPVVCPKCREELDIPPELRGGDVRCASCATVFTPAVEPDDRPSARGWDESPVQPRRANRATRDRDDSSRDADLDRDFDDRSSSRRRSNAPRKSGMLWLWLMLGGTFGICALGCGGLMIFGAMFDNPDMQPYNSPDGKFQAAFPGKNPVVSSQMTDDGLKRNTVEMKRKVMKQDFETFFVHYTDLPKKPKQPEIDKRFQDVVDQLNTKYPSSKEISRTDASFTHQDSPAMDLHIEHDDDTSTIVRLVMVEKRLYAVGITGHGLVPESMRLKAFWDAFKILTPDEKTPAPKKGG